MITPDSASPGSSAKIRRRFALLSFVTAGLTYALIVFGGIVRITGSGMGCGDDWPLCNGKLIPPFDLPTLIEYSHRLAAALIGFFVLGVALYAVRHRRTPGIGDRGIVNLAIVSLILLVAQVLLGAVTVWLELPTATVVFHLIVASALLATLLVGGLLAIQAPAASASVAGATYPRLTAISVALGFLLLILGGLVANTGAAPACQGFPLCNGQLFPRGGGLVHLHWTHRLAAFVFLIVIAAAVTATWRQGAPARTKGWALVSLVLTILQFVVAAGLVLLHLPDDLRALHLAVGTALWGALVVWGSLVMLQKGLPYAAEREIGEPSGGGV